MIVLILGAAYSYHTYMMNNQNTRINQLQTQVDSLNNQNVTLRAAAEINEAAITDLNKSITTQNNLISQLTKNNNEISSERDRYLSIFRRHDLTKLSIAKPGLIENRINIGTADVFKTLEQDTAVEAPK